MYIMFFNYKNNPLTGAVEMKQYSVWDTVGQ